MGYRVIGFTVKDWSLGFLSAILLIISFPKFDLWIFAWFAFVPLFFALRDKPKGKAFLLSFLSGVIAWAGIIYWLYHVTFLGLVLLILYLALYFGIFGLITRSHKPSTTSFQLIFIPAAWVILEYLRSHLFTGFGWGLLGYSQYLNLPLIQVADITGAWGVSFLVMLVNVAIYKLAEVAFKWKSLLKQILPVLLILILTLIYGYFRLSQEIKGQPIRVALIQGNIAQSLKWQAYAKEQIFERYLTLSRESVEDKPDLIIWPEAAMPVVLEQNPLYYEMLRSFIKEIDTPLLFGAATFRNSKYYNSALLLSHQGEFLLRYDKLHLVPFGEYIPLKRIFSFLETVVPVGDFISGEEYTIFPLNRERVAQDAKRLAVLICFEDIFPQISRRFVKKGAGILVNITNDAWFGDTSSPYQHLQASVFRAVENRVNLVRAANTGISAFISPSGKVNALVDEQTGKSTFISGWKTAEIYFSPRGNTAYNRWGDWFILFCLAFSFYTIIFKNRKNRDTPPIRSKGCPDGGGE